MLPFVFAVLVIPSVLFLPIVLSGYFYVSLSVNSVVVSLAV